MAKALKQRKNEGKVTKITTPSRFGSHAKMMVNPQPEGLGDMVLLEDEFGQYLTNRKRLDNGEADPARYAQSRIAGKLEIEEPKNADNN